MKLDKLLEHARHVVAAYDRDRFGPAVALAQGIIDLLGEAQPCGIEPPKVWTDNPPDCVQYIRLDELISPSDAGAYAAMIIRAAEQLKEKRGQT